jgi:beta-N-acetylhexosaminidase|tara:strand:+ start:923 stop:1870 length:948 start_codon:yes stop_codon:yes gene_type:complete
MKNRRSFITGLKSTSLSKKEEIFLKKFKPWGIILFSRNIKTLKQTKILTDKIKKIFKDKKYPILIDQEGGRVNRLDKLIDTSIFSANFFGSLYKKNYKEFLIYYKIFIKEISYLMKNIGANINTVPVLDVRRAKSNNVIGDRSYSTDPKIVSKIGDYCIKEFHKNNIGSIIKHIPGHGLSKVDSHKSTPVISIKLNQLNKIDFKPFKNKKSLFAMTAHIIYKDIDNNNTATHSKKVIKLIRNKIKFKNLLISDDISMKGLKYSIKKNTRMSFNAGCDLVLHCNGKFNEMLIVANNSPILNSFIIKKTSQFYKILS